MALKLGVAVPPAFPVPSPSTPPRSHCVRHRLLLSLTRVLQSESGDGGLPTTGKPISFPDERPQ